MDGSFAAIALVSHIHWDHVQGLPFFAPLHVPGAELHIYAPHQSEGPLGDVFGEFMRPPYFPVRTSELGGNVAFHDITADSFAAGNRKITARPVPHKGPTVGYRVDGPTASVAYISDHQAPLSLDTVDDGVLELADGVDALIHDAQYTSDEFERKSDWGHCTLEYALLVARSARAKRLVMFHHDPAHSDDDIDRMWQRLRAAAPDSVEVIAAREGLVLEL
jgi:phosphoribosyl 1,2-cyclic phosphodiesterase